MVIVVLQKSDIVRIQTVMGFTDAVGWGYHGRLVWVNLVEAIPVRKRILSQECVKCVFEGQTRDFVLK